MPNTVYTHTHTHTHTHTWFAGEYFVGNFILNELLELFVSI